MVETVEVPPEPRVVVTASGARYHRRSALPGRTTACATEFPNGATVRPLTECERDGYGPCRKVGCFGGTESE